MKIKTVLILLVVVGLFVGFYLYKSSQNSRWYTQNQVLAGKELFIKNCAVCHGDKAQKTLNWKKPINGSFPPPPLNGSAHAWHHPKSLLKRIISNGGASYDGKMPPFKDTLSSIQVDTVIAYFQNFWSDEIYATWLKYGGLTK